VSRLDGKIAVVTGAARGMGLAHATAMCEAGAAVVLADVLDDEGEAAAGGGGGGGGGRRGGGL
jgi:3alpha(or 20beta)-hydroxysteroid dehydrogenase